MAFDADKMNAVVQNPALFFHDKDLRDATTVRRPNLKTAWNWGAGGFGYVFRMRHRSGREYAVKFFKHDEPVRDARARELAEYLKSIKLHCDFLIGLEFVEKATKFGHNILKLDWVEGVELHYFVLQKAADPSAILSIAKQLVDAFRVMRARGIGHGDIQHGNILVDRNSKIHLVDYDGMFIPPFKGRPATEIGLPNFQHPNRSKAHFDSRVDDFSILILLLSLRALAARQDLWGLVKPGTDRLLFTREDLVDPKASPLFRALQADPRDTGVREMTAILLKWLQLDFPALPDLLPELDRMEKAIPNLWTRVGNLQPGPLRWNPLPRVAWLPIQPTITQAAAASPSLKIISFGPRDTVVKRGEVVNVFWDVTGATHCELHESFATGAPRVRTFSKAGSLLTGITSDTTIKLRACAGYQVLEDHITIKLAKKGHFLRKMLRLSTN